MNIHYLWTILRCIVQLQGRNRLEFQLQCLVVLSQCHHRPYRHSFRLRGLHHGYHRHRVHCWQEPTCSRHSHNLLGCQFPLERCECPCHNRPFHHCGLRHDHHRLQGMIVRSSGQQTLLHYSSEKCYPSM